MGVEAVAALLTAFLVALPPREGVVAGCVVAASGVCYLSEGEEASSLPIVTCTTVILRILAEETLGGWSSCVV